MTNIFSPWCRVFTDHQLSVMEYREDLEYFWIDGPGFKINGGQACVLVNDALKTFQNIAAGNNQSSGTFYFSHSGTLLKLLAFLNVFKDEEQLRSENFKQMDKRKWRTSQIGPFGGNIAFVLQKCEEEYKIGLYVNEVLTTIPGCDDWCSLTRFMSLYPLLEPCDFDEMCDKPEDEEIINVPDDKY